MQQKINNKTQSQNKINYKTTKTKNQLELRFKFLNADTVATSDTFDSKLFHNTAL